jgi:hypothetical protein
MLLLHCTVLRLDEEKKHATNEVEHRRISSNESFWIRSGGIAFDRMFPGAFNGAATGPKNISFGAGGVQSSDDGSAEQ